MPLDQLIAALGEDADQQAQSELEQARAEAARITAETRDEIVRRRAETLGRLETDLREETERELVETRRRSRGLVLGARQQLLDRVFMAAETRLPDLLDEPAYLSALPGELAVALSYIGEDPAIIHCSPPLAETIGALVAGREGITVQPDDAVGSGFTAVSGDGYVTVDVTLNARLERLRPQLSLEVLRELEESSSGLGSARSP